jgi:kynurenine 3-monooxygenase
MISPTSSKQVTVMGAGLVGAMIAIVLARKGHKVTVFEKRPDLRKVKWEDGRTINLALSERGWNALRLIGLEEAVRQMSIPMPGRMIHALDGKTAFQPYGQEGEAIYAVSRMQLNELMMNMAEKEGVRFVFEQKCQHVNLEHSIIYLNNIDTDEQQALKTDVIVGADGVFSMVRSMMQRTNRFNYQQQYIDHGYKELTIPAGQGGSYLIEKHALHIWPRGHFMFIALPNPDGSFTGTFFFPYEGEPSFDSLKTPAQVRNFFESTFPDVLALAPGIVDEYFRNPVSALVTVRCYPWTYKDNIFLIGDAAHGVVPFYGQGMNAGFEDCVVFSQLLDIHQGDWASLLRAYQQQRKPNADAIADLALENFIEMRDKVADSRFLLRKKIEAHLHQRYPDRWIPLYTMIAFRHDIPYAQARQMGKAHDYILEQVMKVDGIAEKWQELDYEPFLQPNGVAYTLS